MGRYSNIISSGGGFVLGIKDEGVSLDAGVTKINFKGTNVTAVESQTPLI